jgi:hypothetical protein
MNRGVDDQQPKPGDITVTRTSKGFMIGRNTATRDGMGPWWQYIATIATLEDAADFARMVAERDGVRAWMRRTDDQLDPLPMTASELPLDA